MNRAQAVGPDGIGSPVPGRKSRGRVILPGVLLLAGLTIGAHPGDARPRAAKPGPPARPARLDPARFGPAVDNPWLPLVPGTTFRYVEKLGRSVSEIETAVTGETKQVLGVPCVVVRERVREKGRLAQETLAWYAQDEEGNVWIFGEDDREFLERGRVNTEGSWQAGIDGAEAGVVMPGRAAPGEPYRQGWRAGIVEDMAQVAALGDSVATPGGAFSGCLRMKEWSMLESGTDKKWYARGVGLVRAWSAAGEEMLLVSVERP